MLRIKLIIKYCVSCWITYIFVMSVYTARNNEANWGLCGRVCQYLQNSNIHTYTHTHTHTRVPVPFSTSRGSRSIFFVMKLLKVILINLTLLFVRLPAFVRSRQWVFSVLVNDNKLEVL